MYFCNHIGRTIYAPAALVPADGPVVLSAVAADPEEVCADELIAYESNRIGTLVDDQPGAAMAPLVPRLAKAKRVGCDRGIQPWLVPHVQCIDLNAELAALRRTKDPDEIAMIEHAVLGCEAAYTAARKFVRPGVTEVQVYAHLHAAAVEAVGEPIGEFGNDFRSGLPGGPPRARFITDGELYPLDLSVVYRGYSCDLCRTLCVGGKPTDAQREAHRLVLEALDYVEQHARAGVSCRQLYLDVHRMLDGKNGWSFMHHLGHGFGLFCHEAPRLNPHWDDTLQVGDVFTAEPGLYHDDLRGGVRVEQDYLVTDSGLRRLSNHDTGL